MKHYKIGYILLLVVIITVSCDDMLDLEPEDTIVEDKVFEKYSTAEAAVAGTYHLLFEAATTDYMLTEATSSICEFSDRAGENLYDDINNGTVAQDNETVEYIYSSYYAALNQANLLIAKIKELGKYDETQEMTHVAEAKFIRAYAYHRLLVWFGEGALTNELSKDGVVIHLDYYQGFDRDQDIKPRNSNGEVYNQIIKDLEEAMVDLPESVEQQELERKVSRATITHSEALLARVYLYMQNYTKAAEFSQKVIDRTDYKLETDLRTVFPIIENGGATSFSKEHIFGFPVNSNGGNIQFGTNGISYVYNSVWFDDDFVKSYSNTDLRKTILMREDQVKQDGVVVDINVSSKYMSGSYRDNMTMIRLPEMILTKAEALVRSSNAISQESVDLLNSVYLRSNLDESGYETSDFSSADDLLDNILLERMKELACEGLTRFDLIRTDRPLYNAELLDNQKVLPIPLSEIEISNGVVKQNEGYINN